MPRHIVCLTFDHDHLSGFIARGMTSPTAISRGEYDVVVIPRLVALLERYGIKGTFFTPGHTIDSTPQAVAPYVEAGPRARPSRLDAPPPRHSLARGGRGGDRPRQRIDQAHQRTHRAWLPLARLGPLAPFDRAAAEARHPVRQLDDGPRLRLLFRPPGRRRRAAEAVRARPRDALLEMPISWSLDDFPHFEYMRLPNGSVQQGLMNATNVLDNFVDDFTYMTRVQPDFGILTYTFHPHVIGRGHRMMMLERLIQRLIEGGAVFMTMEQAMAEWLARNQSARKAAE
jgi:peptidoglycan/xylan/chitin deacetylase (PgdA/CDA1 family)